MRQNLPVSAITHHLMARSLNTRDVALPPFGRDIFLIETHVAGIQYHAAEAALPGLALGAALRLQREPSNAHDDLAIEIYSAHNQKLGYVPRFRNPVLARLMDAGKALLAEVASVRHGKEAYGGFGFEIRLRISLRDY